MSTSSLWENIGRVYLHQEGIEGAEDARLTSFSFSDFRDGGELYMDVDDHQYILRVDCGEIVDHIELGQQMDNDGDSFDYSDDGDALSSAGWGTDEDYGGYDDCGGDW